MTLPISSVLLPPAAVSPGGSLGCGAHAYCWLAFAAAAAAAAFSLFLSSHAASLLVVLQAAQDQSWHCLHDAVAAAVVVD